MLQLSINQPVLNVPLSCYCATEYVRTLSSSKVSECHAADSVRGVDIHSKLKVCAFLLNILLMRAIILSGFGLRMVSFFQFALFNFF